MKKLLTILAILCFGLFSSCMEDIDLDTGEHILSIYCVLNQGPKQTLELSYIVPINGQSGPVGEDAVIVLYDQDTPVGHFTKESETKWGLNYAPQGGHTYRIEVKVPGEKVLTAQTRYPIESTFNNIGVVQTGKGTPMYGGFMPTLYVGHILESSEDQILWCYYEKTDGEPVLFGHIATDHPGADKRGETVYPFDSSSPITQAFLNGTSLTLINHVFSSVLDGSTPFLHEKVIRICHPAGFSRQYDIEKMQLYKGSPLRLDDSGPTETGMFSIAGVFDPSIPYELVICAVSTEYDNYLSDYYYGYQDPSDFTTLVYKRNHYSNVINGTGIFGASLVFKPFSEGFLE